MIYCIPKICPLPSSLVLNDVRTYSTPEDIINSGAEYYQQDIKRLVSKDRYRPIVEARACIMHTLRSFTSLSLKEVGDKFNRDHTTVIYSVNTVNNLLQTDNNFRLKYQGFIAGLRGRGVVK